VSGLPARPTGGIAKPDAGDADAGDADAGELARRIVESLTARGQSVAVAESLTGGLVAAALTSVPGASVVVRGGIIAYATELKATLLGVPADLLSVHGPVDPQVAAAMAAGVRARLGASYAMSTTGVAGPGPADGKPAGTVFIAVNGPSGSVVRGLQLAGDRSQVRIETVRSVLSLLVSALREDAS
jgi:nicotinamide-nucleotide amidase